MNSLQEAQAKFGISSDRDIQVRGCTLLGITQTARRYMLYNRDEYIYV